MSTRSLLLAALALALLAVPAAAEIYTVSLSNGTQFQTRYPPKEASWDSGIILVLTDVGNWIALEKTNVLSVLSETEKEGFGKVIDTVTIAVGWAPNDAPSQDAEAAMDPMTRLLNFLAAEQTNQPDYSVPQFAEPSEAGRGGLPVSGLTPPAGGVSNLYGVGNTNFPMRDSGNTASQPQVIDN